VARRHEIDYRRRAGRGLEFGFEHQRAWTVAAFRAEYWILWGNEPAPVVSVPKQRGKTRGRIKPRPAQPIDRAVAADQSCRLAIADQRVVFDSKRHCFRPPSPHLLAPVGSEIESREALVIGRSLQHPAMPRCSSASW